MILKQQLKNVVFVTTLQNRECYGTNAEVVEFGCLKCVTSGTLFMVTYGIFASIWPSFLKFFILIKFNIGFFLLMGFHFRCNSILYGSFVISACNYRSGHGNVELWYYPCKILFRSCTSHEFLLLVRIWTGLLSTASWCFTNTCLTLSVQRYINSQCKQGNETFIAEAGLCICHNITLYCLCTYAMLSTP